MYFPFLTEESLLVFAGHVHISFLTIVHNNIVFSDFLLGHRRVSHDTLTTDSDKSHSSNVALWEA